MTHAMGEGYALDATTPRPHAINLVDGMHKVIITERDGRGGGETPKVIYTGTAGEGSSWS